MDDDALDNRFDSIRDYLRADKETEDDNKSRRVIIIAVLLSATALFSLLFAFANDRRLFKNTEIDTGIKEDQKRN
jgi:heme/copper-type cytochrome/quinol oxidase subunit 3